MICYPLSLKPDQFPDMRIHTHNLCNQPLIPQSSHQVMIEMMLLMIMIMMMSPLMPPTPLLTVLTMEVDVLVIEVVVMIKMMVIMMLMMMVVVLTPRVGCRMTIPDNPTLGVNTISKNNGFFNPSMR
jgi:hypothetical protein